MAYLLPQSRDGQARGEVQCGKVIGTDLHPSFLGNTGLVSPTSQPSTNHHEAYPEARVHSPYAQHTPDLQCKTVFLGGCTPLTALGRPIP